MSKGSDKNEYFKWILLGALVTNIIFVAFPWLVGFIFQDAGGGGLTLGLLMLPIILLSIPVSIIVVLTLFISLFVLRPKVIFILAALLLMAVSASHGYYMGNKIYTQGRQDAEQKQEAYRVIGRDEGLRYFEQCRVASIRNFEHQSYHGDERSGVGAIVLYEINDDDEYNWRGINNDDFQEYVKAAENNREKCGEEVYIEQH